MGMFKSIGRNVKKSWQVRKWTDYDNLKDNAKSIKGSFFSLVGKPKKTEEIFDQSTKFDDVLSHYNLTEDQLSEKIKYRKKLSIIYVVLSAFIFIYAIVLFSSSNIASGFSCVAITSIFLCFGFKESYLFYLMKARKVKGDFSGYLSYMLKRK